MKYIDNFLNGITMYKLVLYGLLILATLSIIFGFIGILPYGGLSLLSSLFVLVSVCFLTNFIFGKVFKVETNSESYFITSVILFFLLFPLVGISDIKMFVIVGVLSMASKYLLVVNKKHIFNPTAISVFIVGLFGSGIGSWWVGNPVMLIPVAILGFLVLKKVKRFELFFSFLLSSIISIILVHINSSLTIYDSLTTAFLSGPLLFFGTIMLTEPLTTPPTRKLQIIYGSIVGIIYGLQFNIGPIYSTPELALIIGNIFSYIVSPRIRLVLTLIEKNKLSADVWDFVFKSDRKFNFNPGQYLEWTLGHSKADFRGNRRYFTIASSPTEESVHLGVKFYDNGSSFKKKLSSLNPGDRLFASQLSGEFTLPKELNKKLVFIAGGIGVTPFRSMIKYIIDRREERNITLFFSNRTAKDIVYKDIFDSAEIRGIKVVHAVGDLAGVNPAPNMKIGLIDENMIKTEVPDYKDRIFYISGPRVMVSAFEDILAKIGVKKSNIKTDFFPGYV